MLIALAMRYSPRERKLQQRIAYMQIKRMAGTQTVAPKASTAPWIAGVAVSRGTWSQHLDGRAPQLKLFGGESVKTFAAERWAIA
jgi:hypothetical protein